MIVNKIEQSEIDNTILLNIVNLSLKELYYIVSFHHFLFH